MDVGGMNTSLFEESMGAQRTPLCPSPIKAHKMRLRPLFSRPYLLCEGAVTQYFEV